MLENSQYTLSSIQQLLKTETGTLPKLEKGVNRVINDFNKSSYDMVNRFAELAMYSDAYYKKWYADNSEFAYGMTLHFSNPSERLKYYHSTNDKGEKILYIPLSKEMTNLSNITENGIEILLFVDGRLLDDNIAEVNINYSELSILIKSDLLPADKDIDIVYMRKFLNAQARPYYKTTTPLNKGDTIEFVNPNINISQYCEDLMVLFVKFPGSKFDIPLPRTYYNLVTDEYGIYQYANILSDIPTGTTIELVCLAEWWKWDGVLDSNNTSIPLVSGDYSLPIVDPRDCYAFMDGRLLSPGDEYDIAYSQDPAQPPKLVFKGFVDGVKNKIKIYKSLPYNPSLYLDLNIPLITNTKGLITNLNPYPAIYPLTENVISFTSCKFNTFGNIIEPFIDDEGSIIAHINNRTDVILTARVCLNQGIYRSIVNRGSKLNSFEYNQMKYETKVDTDNRINKYLTKINPIDKGTDEKTLISSAATQTKLSNLLLIYSNHALPIDSTGTLAKDGHGSTSATTYLNYIRGAGITGTNVNVGANINDRNPAPNDAMEIDLSPSPTQEPTGLGSSDIADAFDIIDK